MDQGFEAVEKDLSHFAKKFNIEKQAKQLQFEPI